MTTLYVTEYGSPKGDYNIPLGTPIGQQTVSISSASSTQATSAFQTNTHLIRVHTDSVCSIAISTNPTATTSNMRLAANQTEFFGVAPSGNLKIAVITNT
jgi:hypothetical protein